MKKYIYALAILLLCMIGVDSRRVEAYSVTVQKDGIYVEAIPDSFVNNTAAIFEKNVKKAMKYYNKYKDADDYTYVSSVPDEYRDFIPVAKQIQDTDKIIIRNPFYIYQTMDDTVPCSYSFFAEKEGKKLCMFCINIEPETGEISFWYDKMMDSHFVYDETVGETLFYEIDETIYAETPDKTSVVWNRKSLEGEKMISAGGTMDWEAEQEAMDNEFKKKSYSEKKDEILADLTKRTKEKHINQLEKNLKLELEDEYVESEKDAKESDRTGIYIVIGIGIMVIGVIAGGIIFMKKRKKE